MFIADVAVLTAVRLCGRAPKSVVSAKAAELFQAPEFDEAVAGATIDWLCISGLCAKTHGGKVLEITETGMTTLRGHDKKLADLRKAVSKAVRQ